MVYLETDFENAFKVGETLYDFCFIKNEKIFGDKINPEEFLPRDVKKGSLKHRLFVTITVSIDYLKDAYTIWNSAREAYSNPNYSYLFNPKKLIEKEDNKIAYDLKDLKMSKYYNRDAQIIKRVSKGLIQFFDGNPENIFKEVGYDGKKALELINSKKYKEYFPFISGPKIGSLWLRTLRDMCNIPIELKNVPIAVDVHITRATLTLGVLKGRYCGSIRKIRKQIENVWFEITDRISNIKNNKDFCALDFEVPLWRLSKYGCSSRAKNNSCSFLKEKKCPFRDYCIDGFIKVSQGEKGVIVDTK